MLSSPKKRDMSFNSKYEFSPLTLESYSQYSGVDAEKPWVVDMLTDDMFTDALAQSDFEALLGDVDMVADLGPPPIPVTLGCVDEGEESAASSKSAEELLSVKSSAYEQQGSPQSTGDDSLRRIGKAVSARTRRKRSGRSPLSQFRRPNSPVFPNYSTPLKRSNTSLSYISGDPFGTISSHHSAVSDPGVYYNGTPPPVPSLHGGDFLDGASSVDSPAVSHGSPFAFSSEDVEKENATIKTSMELELPIKVVRRIADLDKRILKLQAERLKLLEKVPNSEDLEEQRLVPGQWTSHSYERLGRIPVFVVPLGIHSLDEPVYEEANSIMRRAGGLYYELESSGRSMNAICYKGRQLAPEIGTCFAYVKSLLSENQTLKMSELKLGMYAVRVDYSPGSCAETLPQELIEAVAAATKYLQAALQITLSYSQVESSLQRVYKSATEKVENCDALCRQINVLDTRERNQIRSVLEGNCAAISAALKVWPKHGERAKQIVSAITECVHPTL